MLLALALAPPAPASAEEILERATYPGMSTFECRTDPIEIYPGQNLNLLSVTTTCPNARKISGPGSVSDFSANSNAEVLITRFSPSMVEVTDGKPETTPSVWDLHLHHVVWIATGNGGPTFASGEEKTIVKLPEGYGYPTTGGANWAINYMIHNLGASGGRQVQITWEIDSVPEGTPGVEPVKVRWMDVAGSPQIYPVFDAERGFDANGDGKFVFPGEVPVADPQAPGFEEAWKISDQRQWRIPNGGATLVFGAGHLHPGGLYVDLQVARDGPDPGSAAGDTISEIRPLFRSEAEYYEPAGAVSWDVSIKATRPDWRVKLKGGDRLFISTTYDVRKASWYESMGIMPVAWTKADDPTARDPFDDEAEVEAMYDAGGVLTHGRLKENIDTKAGKDLKLPNPKKLKSKGRVKKDGIGIEGFTYVKGGYSATRKASRKQMRPPVVRPGNRVLFDNFDAQSWMPDTQQVWHSITSCKAPCNKGSGIGYPLADGPVKFDSGQLGFGTGLSQGVTTQTQQWKTPKLKKQGTYTYFCRIHPFMRGSLRVEKKNKGKKGKKGKRGKKGKKNR